MPTRCVPTVLLCLLSSNLAAQSPSAVRELEDKPIGAPAASALNPYLDVQIGHVFGGDEEFEDALMGSVALNKSIAYGGTDARGWAVPILANVDVIGLATAVSTDSISVDDARDQVKEIALARRGAMVGFFPYWQSLVSPQLRVILHGVAAGKVNALNKPQSDSDGAGKEESETIWLPQLRLFGGVEIHLGDQRPVVLSAGPALSLFSADKYESIHGDRKSSLGAIEFLGAVPLPNGAAFVTEWIIGGGAAEGIRAGLVFSGEL